jgi:CHAT domain-containing protein
LSDFIGVLNVPGKSSGTGTLTLRSTILSEKKAASGISFTATSEKLYNLLIGEIENDIKGKKRICIIPNGKLANIPFQCLGKRLTDSSFHFVVEDYALFYTNTLDIFLTPEDVEKDFKSFTAFGNPDKTLKSAGTEVREIGKILNAGNIYTEDMATEQRAKESLSNNKYVHFATHGVLDYTDFSQSYLKLAVDKDNDGKLSIEEMKALDIVNCNLVMISACETAVTQSESKGWYASPANSLLMNNVKSVVASLWQVDDEATSIFMKEFYKNITSMSKVDALRKAQETLSHNPKYVHPFFWGAFVLYGDWR